MTETTIDLLIEKAVHEKQIDLKEFSVYNKKLNSFYNGNKCPRNHIIKLDNIENADDRRYIAEMVKAKVKATFARKPISVQHCFVTPLRKMLAQYKNGEIESFLKSFYYSRPSYRNVAQFVETFRKMKTVGTSVLVDHVIYLNNAPISTERTTPRIQSLSFRKIVNPVNQKVLEKYALALIYQTNYSVSTIVGKVNFLTKVLNRYEPDCLHWHDNDIRICFQDILTQNHCDNYKKTNIRIIVDLFDFLSEAKLIPFSKAGIYSQEISIRYKKKFIQTAPDEYILLQIFNCIQKATPLVTLSFLILYCTGMRISELASLKRTCLEWQDNRVFIHYYQHKMRKDVSNAIPSVLAEMINNYIHNTPITNNNYLFINREGKPYLGPSIARKIKNFFKEMQIRNKNGTLYKFAPHAYRHLMAKRMRQHGIPIRFIQEQLHHANQSMTLFYVEHFDEQRINEISEWLQKHEQSVATSATDLALEINRKNLVAYAILPNGICTRLPVLGSCKSSCNHCIDCQFFKTSAEWKPVLEEQRDKLERFIEHAKNLGWTKAVANSEQTLNRLTKIIENINLNKEE